MRPSNGRIGHQALQSADEIHGLVEHLLNQRGAVGHVAKHNGLGTGHEREFEAFGRVAVGANGNLVHTEICGRDVSPFGQEEEAAGRLAVHAKGEGGVIGGVVDAINGARDELGLAPKHVKRWLGEAVVDIAIVGHVDFNVLRVMSEFQVEPNATNVARPLVRCYGVEAEQRFVKGGPHTVFDADAGGSTGGGDFNRRRFTAVILDDRRHGRDGVAELAALKRRGVSISLQVRNVDHRLSTAHRLPDAAVDLNRSNRREIESSSHARTDAETVEDRR